MLNSERLLRRQATHAARQNAARPIARPFELEIPPHPNVQARRIATGFATESDQPAAKLLKKHDLRSTKVGQLHSVTSPALGCRYTKRDPLERPHRPNVCHGSDERRCSARPVRTSRQLRGPLNERG
jgi:hypothetical protein